MLHDDDIQHYTIEQGYADYERGFIGDHESRAYLLDDDGETELTEVIR